MNKKALPGANDIVAANSNSKFKYALDKERFGMCMNKMLFPQINPDADKFCQVDYDADYPQPK